MWEVGRFVFGEHAGWQDRGGGCVKQCISLIKLLPVQDKNLDIWVVYMLSYCMALRHKH